MSKDFCYCNGKGCGIKAYCIRYVDGTKTKGESGHWWIDNCDDESRPLYLPIRKK